ncbi:olfactory receptor 11A1-like [Rhinophrynus dorsalis]
MREGNRTLITEFFLVGFGDLHGLKKLFFFIFLIIYVLALIGNCLVISLVAANASLHSPMYFFLSQLSLSEILFTTNIVPNMLHLIMVGGGNVSVTGCLIQFYLIGGPSAAQCLLLAAMSFDRYVAICNPLHYTSIMTSRLQLHIVIFCWLSGFTMLLIDYVFISQLEFCNSNIINHFYCDVANVVEISCSDTSTVKVVNSLIAVPAVLSPFLFTIMTYISILHTILRIPSTSGRQKAFSTCSSHLTVVCMYYGTLITSIYVFPHEEHSVNANKIMALLYIFVTPFFNPLVYSLRNQDIRSAIKNMFIFVESGLAFR